MSSNNLKISIFIDFLSKCLNSLVHIFKLIQFLSFYQKNEIIGNSTLKTKHIIQMRLGNQMVIELSFPQIHYCILLKYL